MRVVEINGKKRKIRGNYAAIKKVTDTYSDYLTMEKWNDARVFGFLSELLWNFFDEFPKPFIFKRRFFKKADIEDIRKATDDVFAIFYGVDPSEDKETKNDQKKPKK